MAKGLQIDIITPILSVMLVLAAILAIVVGPPIWVFFVLIGLAVLTIGISAIRNIVLFKIGTRSLLRRRWMSVIVIAGLMIGTVIISSSLVIGDTMDKMITSVHYDMYHEVDEIIYANGIEEDYQYLSEEEISPYIDSMRDVQHVEDVTAILQTMP